MWVEVDMDSKMTLLVRD